MYRVVQLLYLMAPVYFANMAPPFLKYWKGWNRPVNERWFGSHKTVLGIAVGVLAGIAVTGVQHAVDWSGSLVSYEAWPLLGLELGGGALAGDAVKSLIKRRLGIPPGASWVPADQIDFVLGALVFAAPLAHLGWADVAVIIGFTFVADIVVNQISFRLGIRGTKW